MNPQELILATHNTGKVQEFQALLPQFKCIAQSELNIPEAPETGASFIENALIKARHASRLSKCPALADDSGLVVEALRGEPGIFSARFAGIHSSAEQNITLLLNKLGTNPHRRAFFYCALAYVRFDEDPTPIIATGQCIGQITYDAQGQLGFGYDPIFYLPQYDATFAELDAEVKNRISHRAQALKQLLSEFKKADPMVIR